MEWSLKNRQVRAIRLDKNLNEFDVSLVC
jgi:hypothetical protein